MESDEFRTVRVYTKKYTSKDKDGNTVSLSDFFGKKIVLYFYPLFS